MEHFALPKGLKRYLVKSAPAALKGRGRTARFELVSNGTRLRGLTKRLPEAVYSEGALPSIATRGNEGPRLAWRGKEGGRARGRAVDAQVSRLAGASRAARQKARMLQLTRIAFACLDRHGLHPVAGQRPSISSDPFLMMPRSGEG